MLTNRTPDDANKHCFPFATKSSCTNPPLINTHNPSTMHVHLLGLLVTATAVSATAIPDVATMERPIYITPHVQYWSSIGVLGCKINTNRVAYWDDPVDCNKLCVRVSANGRSVTLLKIDKSRGANDISYDAWNYLVTGQSARDHPIEDGGIDATYKYVDMSECADLLSGAGGKLPLGAWTSISTPLSLCGADTWLRRNYALYNIMDPGCSLGLDEICTLPEQFDWMTTPKCPSPYAGTIDYSGQRHEDIPLPTPGTK